MFFFQQKIKNYIEMKSLLTTGDTVIVAVSGGADSVALLDVLHSLKEYNLRIVVAHLNHMLRGEDSEADAAFVQELALRYGCPYELQSVDVMQLSVEKRLSLEDAGRIARHAWLRDVASRYNANAIAVGHHADDQAETVLMRLLRGAGGTGLSGISSASGGKFVRPLLCSTRREILSYLTKKNITFRTDGSNADTRFLRNRIRHDLLPYLKGYNPSISDRLVATAEILSADEELLESVTEQEFYRIASVTGNGILLDLPILLPKLKGLRFRIYRKGIEMCKGDLTHVAFSHLQQIDDLALSDKPNLTVVFPGSVRITKTYKSLSITTKTGSNIPAASEVLVEGPGTYPLWHDQVLVVTESQPPDDWKMVPRSKAYFDADKATFPWSVRTFRPGDRFTPLGMSGSRKVKDLFIDMKIPADVRKTIPMIVGADTVLWIAGLRVAAHARITAKTTAVVAAEIPL